MSSPCKSHCVAILDHLRVFLETPVLGSGGGIGYESPMDTDHKSKSARRDPTNAAGRVYEVLRNAIMVRTYRPGDVLSRPALARAYGTSQTPVREALLRLEREGLVHVKPQAGTLVAPIRIVDIHQARFLRRALEESVVRQLAARTEVRNLEDIRVLSGKVAGAEPWGEVDCAFHQHLFAAAGMGDLFRRIQPLMTPLHRFRALIPDSEEAARCAATEHLEIVERIEKGDPDGAASAIGAHLASELQALDATRRDQPGLFSDQ